MSLFNLYWVSFKSWNFRASTCFYLLQNTIFRLSATISAELSLGCTQSIISNRSLPFLLYIWIYVSRQKSVYLAPCKIYISVMFSLKYFLEAICELLCITLKAIEGLAKTPDSKWAKNFRSYSIHMHLFCVAVQELRGKSLRNTVDHYLSEWCWASMCRILWSHPVSRRQQN